MIHLLHLFYLFNLFQVEQLSPLRLLVSQLDVCSITTCSTTPATELGGRDGRGEGLVLGTDFRVVLGRGFCLVLSPVHSPFCLEQ